MIIQFLLSSMGPLPAARPPGKRQHARTAPAVGALSAAILRPVS
jgi:hypothetical protein